MSINNRIQIHLNKATAISLANVLVSSRLDYCNFLMFLHSKVKGVVYCPVSCVKSAVPEVREQVIEKHNV